MCEYYNYLWQKIQNPKSKIQNPKSGKTVEVNVPLSFLLENAISESAYGPDSAGGYIDKDAYGLVKEDSPFGLSVLSATFAALGIHEDAAASDASDLADTLIGISLSRPENRKVVETLTSVIKEKAPLIDKIKTASGFGYFAREQSKVIGKTMKVVIDRELLEKYRRFAEQDTAY